MDPAKRKRIEARIKAKLDAGNYAGYSGTSEFLSYDWKRFKEWCCGQLLVAIGSGNFQSEVAGVIMLGMAWSEFQKERRRLLENYGIND